MGTHTKFDAAREYDGGFRYAVLHDAGSLDFVRQTPLWRRGYTFGLSVKKQFIENRNACLIESGFDPIREIELQ